MELKLYIRQTVVINKSGTQIYYAGTNPQSLTSVAGNLPAARQIPGYPNYIDVTTSVSDIYKLKLTWTAEKNDFGEIIPGVTQTKKSASGSIIFEGDAYTYLKKWLIDDVSAPLNSVDVQITHVGVGSYTDYVIKASDLIWCDDKTNCTFDLTIRQKEEALTCIKRTMIDDNHQHWFEEGGGIQRKHPRFSYCNEIRPNGMLVLSWYLMANVAFIAEIINYIIAVVLNPLIFAINGIIVVINVIIAFINALGANINDVALIKFYDPQKLEDNLGNFFIEAAGCGREQPAPLIRDYISNVCSWCGVRVDADTAPLFYNPSYEFIKSTGETVVKYNHYVNATYLNAPSKKGVRRFRNLSVFGYSEPDTDNYWLPGNSPLMTLDMYLDHILPVFNHEWNVENNTLYIRRKDYYTKASNIQVYDFRTGNPDRSKIIEGICYEWDETKYPAYINGIYENDAIDVCGNSAQKPMNSHLEIGNADDNPNFEGHLDKTRQFGATKFRNDGIDTDYIMDAYQVVVNGSWMSIFIGPILNSFVKPALQQYADYALMLKDDTASLPKIIIWDGNGSDNAKAAKYFDLSSTEPSINTKYNSISYRTKYDPKTFVRGSKLTFATKPYGIYRASGTFGNAVYDVPAYVINWPMFFEVGYQDNLWDNFHWIDDPRLFPAMHQTWEVKIELCADDLKHLKVFNDGKNIRLGSKVKLNIPYYPDGKITEIEVCYNTEGIGQYIRLRGTV